MKQEQQATEKLNTQINKFKEEREEDERLHLELEKEIQKELKES